MKKLFIVFMFINCFVFANSKTGIEVGIGGGYRHETVTLTSTLDEPNLSDITAYETSYRNLAIFQINGFFEGYYKNFCVKAFGDYGQILSGDGSLKLPIGFDGLLFSTFPIDTLKGDIYDALGSAGFAINLYRSKCYLIPQIGYGISAQNIKRGKVPTNEILLNTIPVVVTMFYSLEMKNESFKTTWWGPFYGADMEMSLSKRWKLDIGYFYHKLHYKLEDTFTTLINIVVNNAIVAEINSIHHIAAKSSKAFAHQGKSKLSFSFLSNWKLAIAANYCYFQIDDVNAINTENRIIPIDADRVLHVILKSWRHYLSGAFEVSYFF